MHEFSLMNSLMNQIHAVAEREGAKRVSGVTVKLGAFSHISADHFREHFEEAARGTISEGAQLSVIECKDEKAAHAQSITLENIQIEDK